MSAPKNDAYISTPWGAFIYVTTMAVVSGIILGDDPRPGQIPIVVAAMGISLIEYAFAVWKKNR